MFIDKQYKVVPNVVGMEVSEAVEVLKDFKIEYSGFGNKITYQNLSPNSEMYKGETIRLLFN